MVAARKLGRRTPDRRPAVIKLPCPMADTSRTLILIKPDAFERGLTGEILARFERKGLTIVAMRHMTVDRDLAENHWQAQRLWRG